MFLVPLVVFLGVKFVFRKSCLCKRNDKYEVCVWFIWYDWFHYMPLKISVWHQPPLFSSASNSVVAVLIQPFQFMLLFGYHDYRDDGNVGNDNYVTPATTLFQRLQFSCNRFMRKMYEFSHWMDMWRACCNLLDGTFATRTRKTNIFSSSLKIYYLDYTASPIIFQTIWINHWFYSSGPELLERLLKCQTRIQKRFSIDFHSGLLWILQRFSSHKIFYTKTFFFQVACKFM